MSCTPKALINESLTCDFVVIFVNLSNQAYFLSIDFDDGHTTIVNTSVSSIKLYKAYSTEGIYTIEAELINLDVSLYQQIMILSGF